MKRTSLLPLWITALLALCSMSVAFKGKNLLIKFGGRSNNPELLFRTRAWATKSNSETALLPEFLFHNQIPFVDRHAEVFDVVATNLIASVELNPIAKHKIAVGAQIMGSGKTLLGTNLIRALNRPRESRQEEQRIAKRLESARHLWDERAEEIIEAALRDPRDESLTVRTLRTFLKHRCPSLEERVDQLVDDFKRARTVFVSIRGLDLDKHATLNAAIAGAIAEQTLTKRVQYKSAASLCKFLVKELLGGPLFVVLDEIGDLIDNPEFAKWASKRQGESAATGAMRSLASVLELMLSVPGVHVYCTGRTDYISLSALTGSTSPLAPFPIILHPLRTEDIEEMFLLSTKTQKQEPPVNTLLNLSSIATDPKVIRTLSEKLALFSGGNGRAVEYALQFLHSQSPSLLTTEDAAISAVNVACQKALKLLREMRSRALDCSDLISSDTLELIRHYLHSSEPFEEDMEIEVSPKAKLKNNTNKNIFFKDVLSVLGFSYEPAGPGQLRATKGDLQFELLPDTVSWKKQEQIIHNAIAMKYVEGTIRGMVFENVCMRRMEMRLNTPYQLKKTQRLDSLLPHLAKCSVGATEIGTKKFKTLTLPKIIPNTQRLTDAEKKKTASECLKRKSLHPDDLAWLLDNKIEPFTILKSGPQSAAQDWFVVLPDYVICIVNKMYTSEGLKAHQLKEEWDKRPATMQKKTFTLVAYVTFFGPELMKGFGEQSSYLWDASSEEKDKILLVHPDHQDGLLNLLGKEVMGIVNDIKKNAVNNSDDAFN